MTVASNLGFRPGEILLRTRPSGSLLAADQSVVQQLGAEVLERFETTSLQTTGGEFLRLKLPDGVGVQDAVASLSDDPEVVFAVPNTLYRLSSADMAPAKPSDPEFKKLWGLHNEGQKRGTVDADIDAPEAWAVHSGRNQAESGPIVAVLDSGVDYNHPDLAANMWTNPGEIPGDGIDNDNNGVIDDVHGFNAVTGSGDPRDVIGHGTHCAGTVGAVGDNGVGVVGVAKKANIMAVKIFDDEGNTDAATIVRGLQYATKMGARITSNSWGGGEPNEAVKQAFADSPAMHITAAGNDGLTNEFWPSYPANYPLDNIIAVAATDRKDQLTDFSNYGSRSVDLAAPGQDILSTVPGGKYGLKSGTSMSTPHVSGVATLVASAYPEISNEELRARLLGGVDVVYGLGSKTVTGGRLNAYTALTMEPKSGE